jgi:hypothetical protein
MVPKDLTVGESSGREYNPYTRAYLRITRTPVPNGGTQSATNKVSGYSVHVVRKQSVRQRAKMARAKRWASSRSLQRLERLETGSAAFLACATPTVRQLLTHTQRRDGYSPLAGTVHHPPSRARSRSRGCRVLLGRQWFENMQGPQTKGHMVGFPRISLIMLFV